MKKGTHKEHIAKKRFQHCRKLNLSVYYDDSFFHHYGSSNKVDSFIRKVITQAETFFDPHHNFPTKMKFELLHIQQAQGFSWKADNNNIRDISGNKVLLKVYEDYFFLYI